MSKAESALVKLVKRGGKKRSITTGEGKSRGEKEKEGREEEEGHVWSCNN